MSVGHVTVFDDDAADWWCAMDGCYFRTKDTALAGMHDRNGQVPGEDPWTGMRLSLETALEKARNEGRGDALEGVLPLLYKELNAAERVFLRDKRDVSQSEHATACAVQTLMLDLIEEVKAREALAKAWPGRPDQEDVL